MSRTKVPAKNKPAPAAGKKADQKEHPAITHLKKAFSERSKLVKSGKMVTFIWIMIGILAVLSFFLEHGIGALAGLYILGNNGKQSGRRDGDVMMRNGVVRGFSVPALIQNGYTTARRAILSLLSTGYRALPQSDIATWVNATGFTKSNRFGQAFTVKGKELYVELNSNLYTIGGVLITGAPTSGAVNGIVVASLVADASAGSLDLTFTATPTDANVVHAVFATAPLSAGVFKPGASAFRLITTIGASTASPLLAGTAYTTKFGLITTKAGEKIFVKAVPINLTTGQAGAGIVASTVIVP